MPGIKTWVAGEEVKAADLNSYVQLQVVPVFTTAAQRTTQWPAPPAGALSVRNDGPGYTLEQYSGSAWGSPRAGGYGLVSGGGLAAGSAGAGSIQMNAGAAGVSVEVGATRTTVFSNPPGPTFTDKGVLVWKGSGVHPVGIAMYDGAGSFGAQLDVIKTGANPEIRCVNTAGSGFVPIRASSYLTFISEFAAPAPPNLNAVRVVGALDVGIVADTPPGLDDDDAADLVWAAPPGPRRGRLSLRPTTNTPAELRDADLSAGLDLVAVVAALTLAVRQLAARVAELEG